MRWSSTDADIRETSIDAPRMRTGVPMGLSGGTKAMNEAHAPYHAHIYYEAASRPLAETMRCVLSERMAAGELAPLRFVGSLRDGKAGPHPLPQFEIHFTADGLAVVREIIRASGLTALIHPLTDDDLADHTRLAEWIGTPLALDLDTLDPPGRNKGVARFGLSDF
jgi:DOPA 4,5-dioxygenase